MKFNANLVEKNGEYSTTTMTVGALVDAIKAGRVLLPKEQREIKDTCSKYKAKCEAFIAYILIHAFSESEMTAECKAAFKNAFGEDIVISRGVAQFVGISVDADGYVYLSDGQHRFMHYLMDFFNGTAEIKYGTDFGNDFTNARVANLFDAVELEDGDGCEDEDKVININIFDEDDIATIRNTTVIAQCVKTADDEERAALFVAMNTGTAITQADLDKANYGNENMYQAIQAVHKALDAVKMGESVTMPNGKRYSARATAILKTLFDAQMRTLVPLLAHTGLLTYLNKAQTKKYQWKNGSQTQATQVRNFFKATHDMSEEACNKFLMKVMNDVVSIGSMVYEDDESYMDSAKGMKSLLVGQLHAMRTCDIPSAVFAEIAADITSQLVEQNGYRPADGSLRKGKPYTGSYFNNGHKNREKNELFAKWVMAEYNAMEEEISDEN